MSLPFDSLALVPRHLRFMGESDETFLQIADELASEVLPWIQADCRLLDFGCGYGRLAYGLARNGFAGQYIGVDVLPRHVGWLANHFFPQTGGQYQFTTTELKNPRYNPNGKLLQETDLGFAPADFDAVAVMDTFIHLPEGDIAAHLATLAGFLKPGGTLIARFARVPADFSPDTQRDGHPRRIEARLSPNAYAESLDDPTRLVAYREQFLLGQFSDAGLAVELDIPGQWLNPVEAGRNYDLFVLTKRADDQNIVTTKDALIASEIIVTDPVAFDGDVTTTSDNRANDNTAIAELEKADDAASTVATDEPAQVAEVVPIVKEVQAVDALPTVEQTHAVEPLPTVEQTQAHVGSIPAGAIESTPFDLIHDFLTAEDILPEGDIVIEQYAVSIADTATATVAEPPKRLSPELAGGIKKLHVGCGPIHHWPDWWNVDIRAFAGVDECKDVTQPWAWKDLEYIYSEYFLQALTLEDALQFFYHAGNALRQGGVMRLSTPNLRWILLTHLNPHERSDERAIKGTFAVNRAFHGWGHHFLWTESLLRHILKSMGFEDVRLCQYGKSPEAALDHREAHDTFTDAGGELCVIIVECRRGLQPISIPQDLSDQIEDEFVKHVRSGH